MTNELQTEASVEQNEVRQLLESRSVVQGWLERLEAQKGSVSERVLRRVREDYEGRLQDVLNALARHRQIVQEELDRETERLSAAESDYADATDELEETRLRHVIGELDDEAWTERSQVLEEATRSANERQELLRAETARLRELLDQLDERTIDTSAAPAETAAPAAPAAVEEDDGEPDGQDEPAQVVADAGFDSDEPELLAGASDFDDYDPENATFLQQIDRALTDLPTASTGEEEPSEDTAPKPGLKCPECGYTNDLSAWFCGVCGADVG